MPDEQALPDDEQEALLARIRGAQDAAVESGDVARHLTIMAGGIHLVTDDAITSAGLGEWERVNEMGNHLAALAQAVKRLATNTRAALDAEWDSLGIDGWTAGA
jgi:hypothetical protein